MIVTHYFVSIISVDKSEKLPNLYKNIIDKFEGNQNHHRKERLRLFNRIFIFYVFQHLVHFNFPMY